MHCYDVLTGVIPVCFHGDFCVHIMYLSIISMTLKSGCIQLIPLARLLSATTRAALKLVGCVYNSAVVQVVLEETNFQTDKGNNSF